MPIVVTAAWVEKVRSELPELPDAKRERFIRDYGLPPYDAQVLTSAKALANYFEAAVGNFPQPKTVSNWIMSELMRVLKKDDREIEACPVTPENLAELLQMIESGTVSGKIAKTVFEQMYISGMRAAMIVKEQGLVQVKDEGAIELVVDEILAENPAEVEQFKAGKEKLLGFFVGQIMRKTKGKANPQLVNEILLKKLTS